MPVLSVVDGKKVALACLHWKSFPPGAVLTGKPVEDMWRNGQVSQEEFQRYGIWKRICGKKEMSSAECPKCECARIIGIRNHVPCLLTLDGLTAVPTTDIPTQDALPKNRGNFLEQIRQGKHKK